MSNDVIMTREQLLKKEKLTIEKVSLGKGEFIYVREMTGRERDRFENSVLAKEVKDSKGNIVSYERSLDDFRAKLAVNTICDENGNLILDPDDYETLSGNMLGSKLNKIASVAQKLSKIRSEDREDLIKNSEGGQVAASISNSAKGSE